MAGLLHDVGRVAVSNAVWDKPGPLSTDEWEQVRLHPYHSERILAGSPSSPGSHRWSAAITNGWTAAATTAARTAPDLPMPARMLAAADALPDADRASTLTGPPGAGPGERTPARRGRPGTLDAMRSHAVLAAAGHAVPGRRGATRRGSPNARSRCSAWWRAAAATPRSQSRLVISRRTAEHHVQHIYAKIGVSSRAAATLFAVEHDLLPEG